MTLNIKIGTPIFLQIEDIDTQANLCGNNCYPATIKNNNESVAMKKNFLQRKWNQQLHIFKKMMT